MHAYFDSFHVTKMLGGPRTAELLRGKLPPTLKKV